MIPLVSKEPHAELNSPFLTKPTTAGEQASSTAGNVHVQGDLTRWEKHHLNFPEKLMQFLKDGVAKSAIWWSPTEEAVVFHTELLQKEFLDKYFQGNKMDSFIRKLNRWGFRRVPSQRMPVNNAAFYHPSFQQDKPHLVQEMVAGKNAASNQKRKRKGIARDERGAKRVNREVRVSPPLDAGFLAASPTSSNNSKNLVEQRNSSLAQIPSNATLGASSRLYKPIMEAATFPQLQHARTDQDPVHWGRLLAFQQQQHLLHDYQEQKQQQHKGQPQETQEQRRLELTMSQNQPAQQSFLNMEQNSHDLHALLSQQQKHDTSVANRVLSNNAALDSGSATTSALSPFGTNILQQQPPQQQNQDQPLLMSGGAINEQQFWNNNPVSSSTNISTTGESMPLLPRETLGTTTTPYPPPTGEQPGFGIIETANVSCNVSERNVVHHQQERQHQQEQQQQQQHHDLEVSNQILLDQIRRFERSLQQEEASRRRVNSLQESREDNDPLEYMDGFDFESGGHS